MDNDQKPKRDWNDENGVPYGSTLTPLADFEKDIQDRWDDLKHEELINGEWVPIDGDDNPLPRN